MLDSPATHRLRWNVRRWSGSISCPPCWMCIFFIDKTQLLASYPAMEFAKSKLYQCVRGTENALQVTFLPEVLCTLRLIQLE